MLGHDAVTLASWGNFVAMKTIVFYLMCAAAVLLFVGARPAAAQDTHLDSAWRADVARRATLWKAGVAHRAALLHAAMAEADSEARLIDSIEVTPAEVSVRVGDTLALRSIAARLAAVAREKNGRVVPSFRPVFLWPQSTPAFEISGDGKIVVLGPGELVFLVLAGAPVGSPETIRPATAVRLVARP